MYSGVTDFLKSRKLWRLNILLLVCVGSSLFLFSMTGENHTDKYRKSSVLSAANFSKFPRKTDLRGLESGKPDKMVIILTYMRSGSSLTGDLIQQDPDVFYVYEPLFTLSNLMQKETPLTYFTKRDKANTEKKYTTNAVELLEAMLTCDAYNLDVQTLRQYHYAGSATTKEYMKCVKRSDGVMGTASCVPLFLNTCAKSKVSAVKIIRLSLKSLRPLMTKLPGLKVIHLIRDPRGTLRSQERVGEFKRKNAANATAKHCNRVMEDLAASASLNKIFPGRIKTVRYEDIAESPIEETKKLYSFLGLTMTPTIEKYIWNITSAGLPDNCLICTTRNNSVATAYKWRTTLQYNVVKVIDKVCSKVYAKLGYLPLASESEQKNMKIPVNKPVTLVP